MILPYIEQNPLYEGGSIGVFNAAGTPTTTLAASSFNGQPTITYPIAMLRCPSDPAYGQILFTDRADIFGGPNGRGLRHQQLQGRCWLQLGVVRRGRQSGSLGQCGFHRGRQRQRNAGPRCRQRRPLSQQWSRRDGQHRGRRGLYLQAPLHYRRHKQYLHARRGPAPVIAMVRLLGLCQQYDGYRCHLSQCQPDGRPGHYPD